MITNAWVSFKVHFFESAVVDSAFWIWKVIVVPACAVGRILKW